MSGYQPMYGRTDRPLPSVGPIKLTTVEQCNALHQKQIKIALKESFDADPDNPTTHIWLEREHIDNPLRDRGKFVITTELVQIARGGDMDKGVIYDDYRGPNQKAIPVRWDYSQGLWVRE